MKPTADSTSILPEKFELWGLEDIATFYRRSYRQAQRIIDTPGFPPPTPADLRRWVSEHVKAHAYGAWVPAVTSEVDDRLAVGAGVARVVRRGRAAA
jgi:hypothetical protein